MDRERALLAHPHLVIRLAAGLAQGLILYFLFEASRDKTWPANAPLLMSALTTVFLFVPVLFLQGLSTIRLPRLLVWCGAAAAIGAALAVYAEWRGPGLPYYGGQLALHLFLAPGLFIAHTLVAGGDIDRRFMARYATHFDIAWKLALQLVLVTLFEVGFWTLMWLGATLFGLIGLTFLRELMTHGWFVAPAAALVVAGGLHLTDVQPGLVRGMRGLVLVLFSWLLPLLTLLCAGFLVALLFTGLSSLWRIGNASGSLLSAAAILVILINAMLQDGRVERPALLRHTGTLAGLILVPMVVLAGYALALRIGQYGWTVERVATAACILVAGFYALGYAASAFWPGEPIALIARWNFAASLLVLAVLLALFSPLADPARIAVNSQMARLERGAVTPDRFDFNYLKRQGARFGRDALARLEHSANPEIRRLARNTANGTFVSPGPRRAEIAPGSLAAIQVHPAGKFLPASFLSQPWSMTPGGLIIANCVNTDDGGTLRGRPRYKRHCEAVVADFDGDAQQDVLLIRSNEPIGDIGEPFFTANLFRLETDGWREVAILSYPHCKGDLEALRAGTFRLAPPDRPDLMLNGRRSRMEWTARDNRGCDAPPPAAR